MNAKILSSLLVIGLVTLVVGGATWAYFSDTETSEGNTFTAGTLNLELDKEGQIFDGETMQLFNVVDVKPGDSGEETMSVHVDGGNKAWMCLYLDYTETEDGCNEPEEEVDTTCGTGDNGELGTGMNLFVWYDIGQYSSWDCPGAAACINDTEEGDNIWQTGEPILIDHETMEVATDPDNWHHILTENLPWLVQDEVTYMGVEWYVPTATGNEIQGDSLTMDAIFYVEQWRNNENFDCPLLENVPGYQQP
ncbi:MAG: hypothetical protein GF368_04545 [Candidatus Aenigmarchaeota archaeon]|nr:hypothetical protein [Candidatus Aenigmarchaeota archaeon]